jgi:hypothetical protein
LELAANNREASPEKGGRCLPTSLLRPSRPKGGSTRHLQRGGLSRREEEHGPAAAIFRISHRRKAIYIGFRDNVLTPAASLDPGMVTMHSPTATHYRHAHLILESASPSQRGGSHSKQGCSMDSRSAGGGHGRWQVSHTCIRVRDWNKPGKWPGKLFSAAA